MKVTHTDITVRGLRIHARHGVAPAERKVGNDFSVDITLNFNAEAAMRYDDLKATVNYAEVIDVVTDTMLAPSALLENVVWRIANNLLEAFPAVDSGTITLTKLHPPVSTPNDGAAFTASFTR